MVSMEKYEIIILRGTRKTIRRATADNIDNLRMNLINEYKGKGYTNVTVTSIPKDGSKKYRLIGTLFINIEGTNIWRPAKRNTMSEISSACGRPTKTWRA